MFPIELSLVFCAIVKGGQASNEALGFIQIIFILNININTIAGFKREGVSRSNFTISKVSFFTRSKVSLSLDQIICQFSLDRKILALDRKF